MEPALARLRAARLGEKRSAFIEALTLARVSSRTLVPELITRDTVMGETPAWRATSLIVTTLPLRRVFLRANGQLLGASTSKPPVKWTYGLGSGSADR